MEIADAARFDPSNDVYPILLAQRREELGQNATADWLRALSLNPRRDISLTQAAISAELSGDIPLAEKLLLQAEYYNHLWLPRWSLASFYARHNRPQDLFHWARLALERAYTDRTPLFRLCRQAGASDRFILDHILNDDPLNLAAFIYFLGSENTLDALPTAAARLPRTLPSHAPMAFAVESLINANRAEPALRIWRLLPQARQALLVNPAFDEPLSPPAFDWRIPSIPGIETFRGVPAGGIKFTFSGGQPESAELLAQVLYLPGPGPWTFAFESQTRGIPAAQSGLAWTVADLASSAPLSSEEWTKASINWQVPSAGLYRLALLYRRPVGQTRIEGQLMLRNLSLEEARP